MSEREKSVPEGSAEAGEAGERGAAATAAETPAATENTATNPTTNTKDTERLPEAMRRCAPIQTWPAYGLAVFSGFLYFLGFPGIDLWPVSLVALVPLIIAMRGQTPRRAAGLGWAAGFTMTMTGFYWLLEMLKVFSGFPLPLCFFFMAILCAYQGGRIALCGWLYGRAATRGWPAHVVFALAFVASELLYPLLFPWYFGASVHNALPLLQVADLGGPYLVGLVLVAANLAVAELIQARRDARPLDRALVAVGLSAPVVAAAYGFLRISSIEAKARESKAVKVGVVQGNQALFDRKNALAVHRRLTKDLKAKGAELIVWSEAAVPRAFLEPKYQDEVRNGITKDLGVATIVGTVLRRPVEGGAPSGSRRGQFFNTALLADETGAVLGRYDKHYLLAFGEYLPFGDRFPVLYDWSPNSGHFTEGTSIEPFVWGEHRISALICYEDILPAFVNKIVRHADPDLLVNLTNDAWFGDSTEPWIHLALAKLRAVEHRRYLIRATNSGVSAIIDATGGVVTHGGTFREEALLGEARYMRSATGYKLAGDIPWYAVALAVTVMALWSRPRRGGATKPMDRRDAGSSAS
jgi:apolipoprotein N-acyltransferase